MRARNALTIAVAAASGLGYTLRMIPEAKKEDAAAEPAKSPRPVWTTPEVIELNIWSHTEQLKGTPRVDGAISS
jgi:hypothetical protein